MCLDFNRQGVIAGKNVMFKYKQTKEFDVKSFRLQRYSQRSFVIQTIDVLDQYLVKRRINNFKVFIKLF